MLRSTLQVVTKSREELVDLTARVRAIVVGSGVREGLCVVYSPHTTAGITINEGYDPDVTHDLLLALDAMVPHNSGYRHAEGNSAAHMKASLVGASQTIGVGGGDLLLGTWQAVWFCDFDGPRTRTVTVTVMEASA
ncbi:MAG: YjbQ family protein [Armatimonadetes bacterium]|nr:YjbQ family protein [Armatimonadota bacterium]